ncbi:hypothetical protein NMG60_11013898 [Bertholletia excelsa]
MESVKKEKSASEASESATKAKLTDEKTPKSLKPKRKIVKKFIKKNPAHTEEAKLTTGVKARDEDQKIPNSLKVDPKIVKKSVKKVLNKSSPQTKEARLTSEGKAKDEDQETPMPKPMVVKKSVKKSLNEKPLQTKEAELTTEVKASDAEKTVKPFKPKPKIVKKSFKENSTQAKVAEVTPVVKARDEDKRKTIGEGKKQESNQQKNKKLLNGSEEKKSADQKLGERLDQEAVEDFAGLIFMCNSKTKPDCFRYHVMGVSTAKQELVMGIKPGLKLFLYDYDARLLYGIYKASSAGGMRLEPAAFGGGFPVQVRFKVQKDCLPLPENVFKKAIKESYNEKTRKFKTELTSQQVKKLIELFQTPPLLHSHSQYSVQAPQPIPLLPPVATRFGENAHREKKNGNNYTGDEPTRHHASSDYEGNLIPRHTISPMDIASPNPLFLSEKEYRNYGLRREKQMIPPMSGDGTQKSTTALNPLFLSEKEYRTYGLRRETHIAVTSSLGTASTASENYPRDPYYCHDYGGSSTLVDPYYRRDYGGSSSLVDQCLPPPAVPSESYSMTAREIDKNDHYINGDTRQHQKRMVYDEAERPYSDYASRALSDYNQEYHHLGGQPEATSASVSSRYSFAGPPLSYR